MRGLEGLTILAAVSLKVEIGVEVPVSVLLYISAWGPLSEATPVDLLSFELVVSLGFMV